MAYGVKSVERVWERCEKKVRNTIVQKLYRNFGIRTNVITETDFFVEVQQLFFLNFYRYYENDQQFLRFLFICAKNLLRAKLNKTYLDIRHACSDPSEIASLMGLSIEDEVNYNQLWNNMPDRESENFEKKMFSEDTLKTLKKRTSEIETAIIEYICQGFDFTEICGKLGLTKTQFFNHKMNIKSIIESIV